MKKEPQTIMAEKIARDMGIPTLETRKSDEKDFHDIAVWRLKEALEKAYKEGERAGRKVKGFSY